MHKENIITSYTFEKDWLELSVTEPLDVDLAEMGAKALADPFGEILGTGAGKDFGVRGYSFHKAE